MKRNLKRDPLSRINSLIVVAQMIFGGIIIGVVLIQGISQNSSPVQIRILILYLVIFVSLLFLSYKIKNKTWLSLVFIFQIGIIAIAMQQLVLFNLLLLVLGIESVRRFGSRMGLIWASFIAIANSVLQSYAGNFSISALQDGVLNGMVVFFMASLVAALQFALESQRKSEFLNIQLRNANIRLKDYAQKIENFAIIEERNRLSRELHDTLGHRLTVSIVNLEGAAKKIDKDPDLAINIVNTVRSQLQEGLGEVRQTVAMLRSPAELDMSLPKSLRLLAQNVEKVTGLAMNLTLPDLLPPLSGDQRLAIYRIVQEAFTNIQRHAHASTVGVILSADKSSIYLDIKDNGIGYEQSVESDGYGLLGIKERIQKLGGSFKITNEEGMQLNIIIPYKMEAGYE